jgi:TPR repeat protein
MVQDSELRPDRIKSDLAEAESWFKRAATKRYSKAYYWLARLYLKQGRNEDAKLAIDMGVAAGDVPSIHLLARLYLSGKLYEKNLSKATELLETAAARGNIVAKGMLGRVLLSSRKGSQIWFRGLRLLLGAVAGIFVVCCTEGFRSDRLR